MSVAGIVLAAGAGRRMGRPKALMRDSDGVPWLHHAVAALRSAEAGPVLVTLGAGAEEAVPLVPQEAVVVRVEDWHTGLAASLRAALEVAGRDVPAQVHAALVTLVDLPGLRVEAVRRVLGTPTGPPTLRQAVYDGVPGHPVLLGRDHWAALIDSLHGDVGARPYLREHEVETVECGDLGGGQDVDRL